MRTHAWAVGNRLSPSSAWLGGGASANLEALRDGRLDATARLDVGEDIGGGWWRGELRLSFAQPTTLNFVALLSHDVPAFAGRLVVRADNGGAVTTLKAATTPAAKDTLLAFPDATYLHFRLAVEAQNPLASFRAGEAVFGFATATPRTTPWGQPASESFLSTRVVSDAGLVVAHHRAGPTRRLVLSFEDVALDEGDALTGLWLETLGGHHPLLWMPTWQPTAQAATEAEAECLLGRLQESLSWRYDDVGRAALVGLELEELPKGAGR